MSDTETIIEKLPKQEPLAHGVESLAKIIEEGKKLYFVGIGGIGMSATAGIASEEGYDVFGTDQSAVYAPAKDILDDRGIPYKIPYDAKNIEAHPADAYIVSSGEGLDNPEIKALSEAGKPMFSFPELLYEIAKDQIRVVVAGTHGKSTTAGLIGHILQNIDDSSFMTGAVLQEYDTNFYRGHGHYFVFEGDEYKSTFEDTTPKFHHYKPDILVLTNLEYDHPDMFRSFDEMKEEFRHLIANLPEDGLIIYNADSVVLSQLVYQSEIASFGYSIHEPSTFKAEQIQYGAKTKLEVIETIGGKESKQEYTSSLPGKINAYNALAAIAMLRALNFSGELIRPHLDSYYGVKRRFEILGTTGGITIVDDYAHHPTAVRETIEAAKLRFPQSKVWAIFEPHTFSRTAATLSELSQSFNAADEVLISEIYPARESVANASITGEQVVGEIKKHQPNTRLVKDKLAAKDILKAEAKTGDVILVMAVGSFNRLGYELLEEIV